MFSGKWLQPYRRTHPEHIGAPAAFLPPPRSQSYRRNKDNTFGGMGVIPSGKWGKSYPCTCRAPCGEMGKILPPYPSQSPP